MSKEKMIKRALKLMGWFLVINLIFMIFFNSIGKGNTYNAVSFVQMLILLFLTLRMVKQEKE
ncbi:MAG: hypothetical protein AABW88_04865 [Nanoarchaeota archaeon]